MPSLHWQRLTPEQREKYRLKRNAKRAAAQADAQKVREDRINSRVKRYSRGIKGGPIVWDRVGHLAIMREICRRDFWSFFMWAFGAGSNPKGKDWIDPAIHQPLADWFQMHVEEWLGWRAQRIKRQKRLAVIVHRRVGKTTMITQAGQAWLHLLDPEMSSYTGAETTKLATRMIGSIKAVMDGSDPYALFSKLYGNWCADARTWSATEVTHAARRNTARKDPSLGTFSPETSIIGAHPDAYFYDDPFSPEGVSRDVNCFANVNHQVMALEPVIQSDGLIVWPGTRYGETDHFGVAFGDQGVRSVAGMKTDMFPLDEQQGQWDVFFMSGEDEDEEPTTPRIWSRAALKSLKSTNAKFFATQIKNDPTMAEDNPLTRDEIRQCRIKLADVPLSALRFAICCDTAFFSGKNLSGKDETVFIIHGYPRDGSGDVYVMEGYGSPAWREEDFKRALVSRVQQYRRMGRRITHITDEVTMGGKKDAWRSSLTNAFNDVNEPMPNFIEFSRGGLGGKDQKIRRIQAAASFWKDGHVRLIDGAPGIEKLEAQMAQIGQMYHNPRLKKDWADAHADAFQPQLYAPMRRVPAPGPYLRGAQDLGIAGLDLRRFDDDEEFARPPLR